MLFDILKNHLISSRHIEDQEIERSILHFAPSYINDAGRVLFSSLQWGGETYFLVPGRGQWDPESVFYKSLREAAKKGKKIKRLFLIPHRHYMREKTLYRHWELDKAAGIDVEFTIIGLNPGGDTSFLRPDILEFGIWDNQLVSYIYNSQQKESPLPSGEWVLSKRDEDKETANKHWTLLNALSRVDVTPDDVLDEFALEEPLIQSAPLAANLASFLCKGGYLDPSSCDWYHQVWQYLRIMDMVSTPTWHSKFYLDELYISNSNDHSKVLISGTADYSMLAYLIRAFRGKREPEVTVLDQCQTPLLLCQWYSQKQGVNNLKICNESILVYSQEDNFDLITSDAFLTRFAMEEKKQVLKVWEKSLVHNGKVVTTARIDDLTSEGPVQPAVSQIQLFTERAKQLAELWQDFVRIESNALAQQAKLYAEKMVSWSFKNEDEIRNIFENAGLRIVRLNIVDVKGEMKPSKYAQIVAEKK